MEQADDINILLRFLKRVGFKFVVQGKSYFYEEEPFKPMFLNFQELAVTYQFNLDLQKSILLTVLNTYKKYGQIEEYDKLDKAYNSIVATLTNIQKCKGFTNIPKINFSCFEHLYDDLPRKLREWESFKLGINIQKQSIRSELSKKNYRLVYQPKYFDKVEDQVNSLIANYTQFYEPLRTSKQAKEQLFRKQSELIPNGFNFDPVKANIFHCPNGSVVAFKNTKVHPYKAFRKLMVYFNKPVSVTVLNGLTEPTEFRRVLVDLKAKLKGTGLQIRQPERGFYLLTVTNR